MNNKFNVISEYKTASYVYTIYKLKSFINKKDFHFFLIFLRIITLTLRVTKKRLWDSWVKYFVILHLYESNVHFQLSSDTFVPLPKNSLDTFYLIYL
jgi:hypothetical protein